MWRFYFPLVITVAAIVVAQYLQKMVARHVHPLAALMVIYGTAFIVSLVGYLVSGSRIPLWSALSDVSWVTYAMGVVILGLESGSILAYRSGWRVATYAMVVNASSALLLLPLGHLVFREKLNKTNWLGALLCLAGLCLLARK
jgi:drug/metabolite transporter (DMT)-like permease